MADRQSDLFMPMIYVEQISDRRVDEFLFANGHKMGPCHRPIGTLKEHGLFVYDQLRAVAITADLVAETCGGLRRSEAIELARLCADDPALCRVMLRLWREVIFPAFGRPWAVSYQDEKLHTGNTYRFDGWRKIATGQRSGTDQRSNRKGRTKTVWAWNKDSASLKALGEERPSPIRVSQP